MGASRPKGSGKIPGSGRVKGVPNRASILRQELAAQSGPMPIEMLLNAARWHYAKVQDQLKKPKAQQDNAVIQDEFIKAGFYAEKAAPYYHPKLATLTSNVNLEGRLTLEQLVLRSIPDGPANSNALAPAEPEDAGEIETTWTEKAAE